MAEEEVDEDDQSNSDWSLEDAAHNDGFLGDSVDEDINASLPET